MTTAADREAQRRADAAVKMDAYRAAHPELVAKFVGFNNGEATAGQSWAGRRRMAEARLESGVPLDFLDLQALGAR